MAFDVHECFKKNIGYHELSLIGLKCCENIAQEASASVLQAASTIIFQASRLGASCGRINARIGRSAVAGVRMLSYARDALRTVTYRSVS